MRYLILCLLFFHIEALEVQKIKVGEIEMAYYTRGSGHPLVMINGFRATMAQWDPQLLELLEKHYKLILFDNRGAGFSTDTHNDNTTMQQMADDTAGLLKAIGIDSAYALGWSMGARIAQQLAIRHPAMVSKLILCAPNAGGAHQVPTQPETLKLLNSGQGSPEELFFTHNQAGKEAAASIKTSIADASAKGTIPNDFSFSQQTTERQNKARGALWDNSNENFNALAKIKIPVLITDGKEDIIDPPENVRIIANQIPFSWVAFFDSGHAFLFQEATRFAQLVTLFLE